MWWLNNKATWTSIRSLGELQILTRASYFLLISVPILAALWPGVKLFINQYNDSLNTTIEVLNVSTKQLELQGTNFEKKLATSELSKQGESFLNTIKELVGKLEIKINELENEITTASIERNTLPPTWAFLFFSSLLIAVAHLIYQLYAPELIQKISLDDFITNKKETYFKNPTQNDVRAGERFVKDFKSYGRGSIKNRFFDELEAVSKESERDYNAFAVEIGAYCQYSLQSQKNLLAILGSGIFYLAGICLIVWVVTDQSLSVAEAAGWIK